MKKRIVYLLSEFPEKTQTFVRDEINEVQKQGVDVYVISQTSGKGFENGNNISSWTNANVQYLTGYIPKKNIVRYFLCYLLKSPIRFLSTAILFSRYDSKTVSYRFGYVLHAANLVDKISPAHIHVHFAFHASELAVFVSRLTGIPFSITAHANDIFTNPVNIDFKFSHAKFIVAISEFGKDYICNTLVRDNPKICAKVNVVHCGIDPEIVKRHQSLRKDEKLAILSVGRLVEKKGMEFLIKACHVLVEKGTNNFKCTIIGDGPLLASLIALRDELKLNDYVDIVGARPHGEIIDQLSSTDIFVLACIKTRDNDMDGIPVSLMEAMALSIPVISTSISGISELIHGGGYLCNPENVNDLADKIEYLYNMNDEQRKLLGEEGKKIILSEFNRTKEVTKLSNLIFGKN